jgi:hypothetical protein
MAHEPKTDFVFRRKGRVHLNRPGASVQSTAGSRGVRISGSNAGYSMFRGSVKGTGYPLHSTVSPSLPLPWVTVCLHISTGLYNVQLSNIHWDLRPLQVTPPRCIETSGTLQSVTLRNAQKNKDVLLTLSNVAVVGLNIIHDNSYDRIYSRFYSVSLDKF